jgi:hypothetical protein
VSTSKVKQGQVSRNGFRVSTLVPFRSFPPHFLRVTCCPSRFSLHPCFFILAHLCSVTCSSSTLDDTRELGRQARVIEEQTQVSESTDRAFAPGAELLPLHNLPHSGKADMMHRYVGRKEIDLRELVELVQRRGGPLAVSRCRSWVQLAHELGATDGRTKLSGSTSTRLKSLYHYAVKELEARNVTVLGLSDAASPEATAEGKTLNRVGGNEIDLVKQTPKICETRVTELKTQPGETHKLLQSANKKIEEENGKEGGMTSLREEEVLLSGNGRESEEMVRDWERTMLGGSGQYLMKSAEENATFALTAHPVGQYRKATYCNNLRTQYELIPRNPCRACGKVHLVGQYRKKRYPSDLRTQYELIPLNPCRSCGLRVKKKVRKPKYKDPEVRRKALNLPCVNCGVQNRFWKLAASDDERLFAFDRQVTFPASDISWPCGRGEAHWESDCNGGLTFEPRPLVGEHTGRGWGGGGGGGWGFRGAETFNMLPQLSDFSGVSPHAPPERAAGNPWGDGNELMDVPASWLPPPMEAGAGLGGLSSSVFCTWPPTQQKI